jgi:hypothetical protein
MTSAPTPLRQLIESRLSQLSAETESLFVEARQQARREMADQLNQAARRIRQSGGLDELCATLADAVGAFAAGTILFRVDAGAAKSDRLEIPLDAAPALRGAIETRDPVIAAATAGELSAPLLDLVGQPADSRVCIFPLVARDALMARDGVPALVCAWGGVDGSSLELLAQVAASVWSAVAPPPPPADLVTIAPAAAPPAAEDATAKAPAAPEPASAWDKLPIEQQQMHLRAQRFARVQAAEMRLFETDAVHAGRERHDLYGALGPSIDRARDAFRKQYFTACPGMVDYLHLELVRTLANDDPELLGKDYPGPLV